MSSYSPWEMLCVRYQQHTLPHAMLLINAGNIGLKFAQHVFNINVETHVDFLHLNSPDILKIDEIRELIQFANQTSRLGQYKVILIENAERMNTAAANALLKTLEEPPGQMLMLLTTQHPHILLPTIRSRCQMIRCDSPTAPSNSQEYLSELKDILSGKGDIVKICERWAKLDQIVLLEALTQHIMDFIQAKSLQGNIAVTQKLFTYLDRLYEARRCALNHLNPNIQLQLENLFLPV
jgi:DNA polymerase III delta prime subunit